MLTPEVLRILSCSCCGGTLNLLAPGVQCEMCGESYHQTDHGSLDLRLKKKKNYRLEFELQTPLLPENGFDFTPLRPNEKPEVNFSGMEIPHHLSMEMLSHFPKAKAPDSLMLDLGCGRSVHKEVSERAGFQWVGVDYNESKAPPILGDAHSLPFRSDSFEFVLSIAMLEHIRFPFVAVQEIHRVLRPGGKFVGTVAFLEPFHGNSFYHHSGLGIFNLLQSGGFSIHQIAPNEDWSGLKALASMALFPHVPRLLSRAFVYPVQKMHELSWFLAGRRKEKFSKNRRLLSLTGAFAFIAVKSGS